MARGPPAQPGADGSRALGWMMLSRAYDARATAPPAPGAGSARFSPVKGPGGPAWVGSSLALDPATDWIAPTYREPARPGAPRPTPLERIMAGSMGKMACARIPDGRAPCCPTRLALATQLQQRGRAGVGGPEAAAPARRRHGVLRRGRRQRGATFHEACNMAGVRRAPPIVVRAHEQPVGDLHQPRGAERRRLPPPGGGLRLSWRRR